METAKTVSESTKMKNADSLSTDRLSARSEEPGTVNEYVSPEITVYAKMMPMMDATDALKNAAYVLNLSFLCRKRAAIAPIR